MLYEQEGRTDRGTWVTIALVAMTHQPRADDAHRGYAGYYGWSKYVDSKSEIKVKETGEKN